MHSEKKFSSHVLCKSSSKTSNKNLRAKLLYNSCKEYYFFFLEQMKLDCFPSKVQRPSILPQQRFASNKNKNLNNNKQNLYIIKSLFALFRFFKWTSFTMGSVFQDLHDPLFHLRFVILLRCHEIHLQINKQNKQIYTHRYIYKSRRIIFDSQSQFIKG